MPKFEQLAGNRSNKILDFYDIGGHLISRKSVPDDGGNLPQLSGSGSIGHYKRYLPPPKAGNSNFTNLYAQKKVRFHMNADSENQLSDGQNNQNDGRKD